MNREINKVKLFCNNNEQSIETYELTKEVLERYHFEIVDEDYDLAIAIGGDGSFLRMVKQTAFNSNTYYVGINSGTLGFLQEIKPEEVEIFIARINNGDYKTEEISVQETVVKGKIHSSRFFSLNEVVIRDKELNTTSLTIKIDDCLLENFVGDGILISTSIGSTAYNLSFGGSIVYGTLHTLQITPIAPLNSKAYRNLMNPVIIPEDKVIHVIPKKEKRNLILSIDGDTDSYRGVEEIVTKVGDKKIYCLRMNNYDYTNIINEKFLK
jgi:Predicted sugar kinase